MGLNGIFLPPSPASLEREALLGGQPGLVSVAEASSWHSGTSCSSWGVPKAGAEEPGSVMRIRTALRGLSPSGSSSETEGQWLCPTPQLQ